MYSVMYTYVLLCTLSTWTERQRAILPGELLLTETRAPVTPAAASAVLGTVGQRELGPETNIIY